MLEMLENQVLKPFSTPGPRLLLR